MFNSTTSQRPSLSPVLPVTNVSQPVELPAAAAAEAKGKQDLDADERQFLVSVIDFSSLPAWAQMMIAVTGIFGGYVVYGYAQERLFRTPGFTFGWVLTLFQFTVYAVLSGTERVLTGDVQRRAPWWSYAILAFTLVASMGLSNTACTILPYPTQVVFKSTKTIPVMIAGFFILGQSYQFLEYVATGLLTAGLITFTLADQTARGSLEFPTAGILLMTGALCGDACIANYQSLVFRKFKVNPREMLYYSDVVGAAYLLVIAFAVGELFPAIYYLYNYPSLVGWMLVFSVSGYIGVQFVLAAIRRFGPLLVVVITSTRKAVTLVVSFIVFPKPMAPGHVYGGVILFSGILLHAYVKNRADVDRIVRIWVAKMMATRASNGEHRKLLDV